jgi:hypothetical protein
MVKNTLSKTLNNYQNVTVEPETAEVDIHIRSGAR